MTTPLDDAVTGNVAQPDAPSRKAVWAGRIISAIPALMLLMSAGMKLAKLDMVVKGTVESGFQEKLIVPLGVVELACTLIYIFPRTAVLGAILLTGYLGGATVTHVRLGQPFTIPVLLGVLVWLGVFLREPRLRALIPLRRAR
jgi:hypothetical protein